MLRRSPRALVLWAAALVVAVLTAAVVGTDLAAIHRRAAGLGPEVPAVVAGRDLPTGAVIDGPDVGVRRVHRTQLPPGTLTDPHDARARVVAVPVLAGGYVTERNLAPRARTGLDGVVPAGMRAIRVEAATGLVPRLGAVVDVLASFAGGVDSAGATVIVAAGALVLDTDERDSGGTGRVGGGVTLLVDPGEARDLADAQANGVLALALAPPEEAARPPRGLGR
jgi:Flp pilus assembly protein CpaB